MDTLSQRAVAVNRLRAAYANSNPACFCQCGKFCPGADACTPAIGETHQPFWTLREVNSPRGHAWAGILWDPAAQRPIVHTLFGRLYATPCQAAAALLRQAMQSAQYPIRLDHDEFVTVDLAAIEERLAEQFVERSGLTWELPVKAEVRA